MWADHELRTDITIYNQDDIITTTTEIHMEALWVHLSDVSYVPGTN